jgi:hypothetical protein
MGVTEEKEKSTKNARMKRQPSLSFIYHLESFELYSYLLLRTPKRLNAEIPFRIRSLISPPRRFLIFINRLKYPSSPRFPSSCTRSLTTSTSIVLDASSGDSEPRAPLIIEPDLRCRVTTHGRVLSIYHPNASFPDCEGRRWIDGLDSHEFGLLIFWGPGLGYTMYEGSGILRANEDEA